MLRVENLNTGYGKKQVLYDISLEVKQGDIALIIGSNGSGKSTFLKTLFGICKAWRGSVYFDDREITNEVTSSLLKKGILYVPQKNNLFEQLSVEENMKVSGLSLRDKKLFSDRYQNALSMVSGIEQLRFSKPIKMSGGERQKVVLAMALLHQPKLLLLDEPFNGLSPKVIEEISTILLKINREFNITILIVEHRIREALLLADQLICFKLGKVTHNTTEIVTFNNRLIQEILI